MGMSTALCFAHSRKNRRSFSYRDPVPEDCFVAMHFVKFPSQSKSIDLSVYKHVEEVMAAQTDLEDEVARFDPRLVKMPSHGERPED